MKRREGRKRKRNTKEIRGVRHLRNCYKGGRRRTFGKIIKNKPDTTKPDNNPKPQDER